MMNRFLFALWAALMSFFAGGCASQAGQARRLDEPSFVYIGTYNNFDMLNPQRAAPAGERSKGLYVARFDPGKGTLSAPEVAAEAVNPTFIAFHPTRPVLYAANENHQASLSPPSGVSAFGIDAATGRLTLLNQVAPGGTGACYVKVDAEGRDVLVANFTSGSVAVLPLEPDGRLKPASAFVQHQGTGPSPRQAGPHSHAINLTPDGRYAVAAEFGADRLFVYRFDARAGSLVPHDPPSVAVAPGSAPRHLVFDRAGRICYLLNEIANTITVFDFDGAKAAFKERQTISTLPAEFTGMNTAAELQVHPSGKFLFASNRGHHSIAVFPIQTGGSLGAPKHYGVEGRTPRNFSLDPSGRWLIVANQSTNNVVVFAVDQLTGVLTPNGQSVTVPAPLCVRLWQP